MVGLDISLTQGLQDQLPGTLHEPGVAPLMPHEDFDLGLFSHLQQRRGLED